MTKMYSIKEVAEATGDSLPKVRAMCNSFHHSAFHNPEGMDFDTAVILVKNLQRELDVEMAGNLDRENQILLSRLRMALQKIADLQCELGRE